jgi:hypothetical protein
VLPLLNKVFNFGKRIIQAFVKFLIIKLKVNNEEVEDNYIKLIRERKSLNKYTIVGTPLSSSKRCARTAFNVPHLIFTENI